MVDANVLRPRDKSTRANISKQRALSELGNSTTLVVPLRIIYNKQRDSAIGVFVSRVGTDTIVLPILQTIDMIRLHSDKSDHVPQ